MFCNECGHENRNDRKFCSECGSKLRDYTKPVENLVMPQEIEAAKENVRRKNKVSKTCNIIFWFLFALSILLIVPIFFVENTLKIVLVCSSVLSFIGMIIALIVKKALLIKINKGN